MEIAALRAPRRAVALVLLLGAGLAEVTEARADSPEREAARHFEAALERVDAGAYPEAIAEFLRAYELRPHYSVLYNLALAYAEAGQHTLAIATFERYLEAGKAHLSEARADSVKDLIVEQKKQLAELEVRLEPDSARLFINGSEVVPAPDGTLALDPATYDLAVRAPGHEEHVSRVSLSSGKRTRFVVSLEPTRAAEPPRMLRIVCAIPDVTIDVDGRVAGLTSGRAELDYEAPSGARELRFSRPGYAPRRVALNGVPPGRAVDCSPLRPTRDRALPGAELVVTVSESKAVQTLDGEPLLSQPLVPGRHVLTVTRAGFLPWSKLITLAPGRASHVDVVLEPTRAYRREYERKARTQRSWAYAAGAGALGLGLSATLLRLYNDDRYDRWEEARDSLPPPAAPLSDDLDEREALEARRKKNDELESSIRRVDQLTVGLAAGSVALLGGATWLFFSAPPDRYSRTGSWTWNVTAGGLSVRSEF